MERFREEEDPYRRFLVTGESLYQKEQRKDKTPVTINKPSKSPRSEHMENLSYIALEVQKL